jgi:hypothetical protein
LCFLLSADSTFVEFLTTLSLSQSTLVAWSLTIWIPNILNLNRMYCEASVPAQRAINSETKVLDSTVFCLLLYHKIGAMFRKNKKPVCDLRVFLLDAREASTNSVVMTGRPLGQGMSCGICSSAPRYCSAKSSLLVRKSP